MPKVIVPLAKGFEEIEAVAIIDVMRRAGIEVIVAGVDADLVEGANGISIKSDTQIDDLRLDGVDMMVLPGGWGGTEILAKNERVQSMLKELKDSDRRVGAICAAPFALNQAGVLNQNYTCYPSFEEKIRLDGYSDSEKVVIDGNVMTSRGPATAICFGLAIVKELCSEDIYLALKEGLLADYC